MDSKNWRRFSHRFGLRVGDRISKQNWPVAFRLNEDLPIEKRIEHLEAAAAPKDPVLRTRSELFCSKGLRYLSTRGGFLLVLRRLISLRGARAIIVALGIDCHRTMEIQSKYIRKDVLHFESNVESQEFIDSIESRSAMGNICHVQFPTAMGTHALYWKHMSSIGCPWLCNCIAT